MKTLIKGEFKEIKHLTIEELKECEKDLTKLSNDGMNAMRTLTTIMSIKRELEEVKKELKNR